MAQPTKRVDHLSMNGKPLCGKAARTLILTHNARLVTCTNCQRLMASHKVNAPLIEVIA